MLRQAVAVLTMALLSVSMTKAQNVINGAGATFPYPLISKWSSEYQKINPNVRINYQAIGSGGGIRQLIVGTVQFGASDAPMTEEQLADAKKAHGDVIHIPETLGAVVVVYNLPGLKKSLKFDGQTIADIYLGKITAWNDARIGALNPGVNLPDTRIVVVHRADGSGTTYIFADYLSKVSPEWATKAGKSTSLEWPAGVGGKGNDGVAGQVARTPGAIGYVELIYALQNDISFADIKNAAGVFVHPSIPGVTEALANAAKTLPEDLRFSITNAPGEKSYPISSATWFLIYREQPEYNQAKDVLEFMRWAVTEGQKYSANLNYAPLPVKIQKLNIARLKKVTFNGKSILK